MRGVTVFATFVAACAIGCAATPGRVEPPPTSESVLPKLQAAYAAERNATVRYRAFARRADREGYGQVASLFVATARSEEIHADNHMVLIRYLGGTLNATIETPSVRSTRENLGISAAREIAEQDPNYLVLVNHAKRLSNPRAVLIYRFAERAEHTHETLFRDALDNLDAWKGPVRTFFVCPVCGYVVKERDAEGYCPSCNTRQVRYEREGLYIPRS